MRQQELIGDVPAILRDLRSRLHWTQAQLAAALNVHRSTISRWERGRNRPSAASARRVRALAQGMRHGNPGREALRREILAKLNGRRPIASVSGGKDSAAMSLFLSELGIDHNRVFLDTGWESELTYEYLRGELPRVIGPIEWVRAPRQMEALIAHKGMFPSRLKRFCTQDLKVFPMAKYLRSLIDAGQDVVNAVGVRAAESEARARLSEWEWEDTFDCEIWRPLLKWSEADVIAIHRRHGLAPNPLYLLGASRVGCWPCIYARKSEIRLIADTDPKRIVRLRVLEDQVGKQAAERARLQGRELACSPSWFQNRLSTRLPNGKRDGACWPIEKVVTWSRTPTRGIALDQEEFLLASKSDGCMRWGLCATESEGADPLAGPHVEREALHGIA